MKSPRLFVDQPLNIDDLVELNRDASKYMTRVLRRATGEALTLFNGDGMNYPATLAETTGKNALVRIVARQPNQTQSPLHITLVQSLAKGMKLDLVIQKASELGVARISPVSADRSVLQLENKRVDTRMEHWRGVAISACTQCHRSTLPDIDRPQTFKQWLAHSGDIKNRFLLHPTANYSLASVPNPGTECCVIVGPEGGFSDHEIATAADQGITRVSCGPRVLRTETAGFTALAILQSRFGDLN